MVRLENGSYDEIVAHLERDLEPNTLEESENYSGVIDFLNSQA